MTWELTISGGKTITLAKWQERLGRLGAIVEFHPQFGMYRSSENLPIALTITPDARFGDAPAFSRRGRLAGMLQFCIQSFGTLDRGVAQQKSLLSEFDQRIKKLAGDVDAETIAMERERRASLDRALKDTPDVQRVYIAAPDGHLLAHTLCSAAYALACGGTLTANENPNASFNGDEVLGWMADRFAMAAITPHLLAGTRPFGGWDSPIQAEPEPAPPPAAAPATEPQS